MSQQVSMAPVTNARIMPKLESPLMRRWVGIYSGDSAELSSSKVDKPLLKFQWVALFGRELPARSFKCGTDDSGRMLVEFSYYILS